MFEGLLFFCLTKILGAMNPALELLALGRQIGWSDLLVQPGMQLGQQSRGTEKSPGLSGNPRDQRIAVYPLEHDAISALDLYQFMRRWAGCSRRMNRP